MEQQILTVLSNEKLVNGVYKMVLNGKVSAITNCGQFINIKIDNLFLRRPISVCDYTSDSVTIIYKVVGHGTEILKDKVKGDLLDCLLGLGNGYDLTLSGEEPLLIGGGVGVPPMYNLAKKLIEQGKKVTVILGFNKPEEIFYEKEFISLGA